MLHPFPNRPAGHVGDFDPPGLQFISNLVGLGKVLGLFGLSALKDQFTDFRIRLPFMPHKIDIACNF